MIDAHGDKILELTGAASMGRVIFFYGLFMDRALLVEKGLHPEMVGPAVLPGSRIHIGARGIRPE